MRGVPVLLVNPAYPNPIVADRAIEHKFYFLALSPSLSEDTICLTKERGIYEPAFGDVCDFAEVWVSKWTALETQVGFSPASVPLLHGSSPKTRISS